MGRGRRPRDNGPTIRPLEAEGGPDKAPRRCWQFELVGTTPAAARAAASTPITGSVRSGHVTVVARGEALGFAPEAEAAQMIAAAKESGGSLRGSVLAADNGGANVPVELCLRS